MQMSIKQIFLLLLKKNTLSLHKNRLNLLNFCEFSKNSLFCGGTKLRIVCTVLIVCALHENEPFLHCA